MKKNLTKVFSLIMAVAILCTLTIPSAFAAGSTRKCYTISAGNTTAYTDTGLTKKAGTIYASDELTVLSVTSKYTEFVVVL